jgi:hypothetical protein
LANETNKETTLPWTIEQVESHIKGLNSHQKSVWVAVANSALERCQKEGGKDCEASAIKQANATAQKAKESMQEEDTDSTEVLTEAGKRHSKADQEMIQGIHDNASSLGASCDYANAAAGGPLVWPGMESLREAIHAIAVALAPARQGSVVIEEAQAFDLLTKLQPFTEREIPQKQREDIAAEDFAGKDKSFPIVKCEDVAAAAKSIGRAGADNYDTDTLKANIIRIAKRKGFEKCLPEAWKNSKKESKVADGKPDTVALFEAEFSEMEGSLVEV